MGTFLGGITQCMVDAFDSSETKSLSIIMGADKPELNEKVKSTVI